MDTSKRMKWYMKDYYNISEEHWTYLKNRDIFELWHCQALIEDFYFNNHSLYMNDNRTNFIEFVCEHNLIGKPLEELLVLFTLHTGLKYKPRVFNSMEAYE